MFKFPKCCLGSKGLIILCASLVLFLLLQEILEDYLDSQGDLKREREMAVADEKLQPDLELLYSMVRNAMHDTERKANREIRTLKREVIELKSLLLTLVGNTGTRNKRNSRERNSRRPSPGTGINIFSFVIL